MSEELLKHIEKQSEEVTRLKQTYGITKEDVDVLKKIGIEYTNPETKELQAKLYAKLSKGMSKQNNLSEAPDQAWQADIDAGLLDDRIGYCTRINPIVGADFEKALVGSNAVAAKDWVFAPPKNFPRSKVKLDE